ncbi:MAG: sulfatase-like hydrolase/transferase [Bryobacteraceae bacterium]
MHRRTFLSAAASAPALLAADTRPNLLLILTDQQTHTALSCAGNRWVRTPAMDSIAADGVRYTEAYAAYPVCSPSRGSIFTGQMPHQTGVRVNGNSIAAGMPTMGELFRGAGYETVYGGKWHLPKSFDGMTGFTKLIGGSALGKDMDSPLADRCASWLRANAKRTSPFLMVASFMNPHDICQWIRDHKGSREYPNPDLFPPAPANMAVDVNEPEMMQYHRTAGYDLMSQAVGIASEWKRDDMRLYLHDYYRMVEDVDRQIGKVLDALRQSGLASNTVIAFASDHGEGMGAHRWAQKAAFWEETAHVPFLLSGPGIAAGVDRSRLVSLADILPTLCDFGGLDIPKGLEGESLRRPSHRSQVVSELRYGSAEREGRMLGPRVTSMLRSPEHEANSCSTCSWTLARHSTSPRAPKTADSSTNIAGSWPHGSLAPVTTFAGHDSCVHFSVDSLFLFTPHPTFGE